MSRARTTLLLLHLVIAIAIWIKVIFITVTFIKTIFDFVWEWDLNCERRIAMRAIQPQPQRTLALRAQALLDVVGLRIAGLRLGRRALVIFDHYYYYSTRFWVLNRVTEFLDDLIYGLVAVKYATRCQQCGCCKVVTLLLEVNLGDVGEELLVLGFRRVNELAEEGSTRLRVALRCAVSLSTRI
jgi:hypothetical protein